MREKERVREKKRVREKERVRKKERDFWNILQFIHIKFK